MSDERKKAAQADEPLEMPRDLPMPTYDFQRPEEGTVHVGIPSRAESQEGELGLSHAFEKLKLDNL